MGNKIGIQHITYAQSLYLIETYGFKEIALKHFDDMHRYPYHIPLYSIGEMIGILQRRGWDVYIKNNDVWIVNGSINQTFKHKDLVNDLYKALCWVLERELDATHKKEEEHENNEETSNTLEDKREEELDDLKDDRYELATNTEDHKEDDE